MRFFSVFVLVLGGVAFAGGVPAASAVPLTCQGQVATVVGTPGGRADGTPGADVIVSNDASVVDAGAGNDVICVTTDPNTSTSGGVTVLAGDGDDNVEIEQFDIVQASLGAGADAYRGSTGPDLVYGNSNESDDSDPDVIDTQGDGVVYVGDGGVLEDQVDLGGGYSYLHVNASSMSATASLTGGSRNTELFAGTTGETWTIDNSSATGTASVEGVQRLSWTGFDNFTWLGDVVFNGGPRGESITAQQLLGAHMSGGTDVATAGRLLSGAGPRSISGGPDGDYDELYLDGLPFAEPGPTDIVVDMSKRRATFAGQAPITFSGFEHIRAVGVDRAVMKGSARDDDFVGSACHLVMRGSTGDDHLFNLTNRNELVCNTDTPTAKLMGEDGNDVLFGSYFTDYIDGGNGNDLLSASKGDDTLYGRAGADRLVGKDGDDVLYGGKGADRMQGIFGSDRLIGGRGNDRADGGGYGDSDSDSIDTCKAERKIRCER